MLILKPYTSTRGYAMVWLGNKKNCTIHRLVAEHFLETDGADNLINHKDGNQLNNKVDNLEWCNQTENMHHYWHFKKKGINRSVTDVRNIAGRLTDKFQNPSRFKFYCKVAWHLSEREIANNLEAAINGRDPKKLFSYLCSQNLKHRAERTATFFQEIPAQ